MKRKMVRNMHIHDGFHEILGSLTTMKSIAGSR